MRASQRTDLPADVRAREAVRIQAAALRARACTLARAIQQTHAELVATVEASRRCLITVQDAQTPRGPVLAPPSALLLALAAVGLDAEGDLDELTEALLAAYRDAVAWENEPLVALLGGALREIGRCLAGRIGPRAAGALSS